MKFENISTEDDFREGQIRMAVLWEREDVDRFSEFFKLDMVDVVHLISDEGVVGALLSPQLPSAEAGSDEYYVVDDVLLDNLFKAHKAGQWPDVLLAIEELRERFDSTHPNNDEPLRADGSCVNCGEIDQHSILCHWWQRYGNSPQAKKTNGGL